MSRDAVMTSYKNVQLRLMSDNVVLVRNISRTVPDYSALFTTVAIHCIVYLSLIVSCVHAHAYTHTSVSHSAQDSKDVVVRDIIYIVFIYNSAVAMTAGSHKQNPYNFTQTNVNSFTHNKLASLARPSSFLNTGFIPQSIMPSHCLHDDGGHLDCGSPL
jgi:hypothetical protein